jgi:lipooligosaccharide transport system permease protein
MRLPGDIELDYAMAVWWRNVTVYRRTWVKNILPNFFEPLLYLLGMGVGLGYYMGSGIEGEDYLAFIGPGLLASAAMNGAVFETTYNMFVKMYFAKLYDAFLCTPARIKDIAFGELMWAVTRSVIYGFGFFVVLLGLTISGYPILKSGWSVLLIPASALIGMTFGLIGQLFTASIRNIDLYSYFYTLFVTPLFLFSGIFFPTSRFPYGDEVAFFTPLYHGVRLCRGLAAGNLGSEVLVSALWMVVVCAVLLAVVPGRLKPRTSN